ncbi:MAG: exodeoxyribonuclease VII large subunit, partial [Acutalibacteraceae bacterium]
MNAVLSVSQINTYLKSIFDYDENLKNVYVVGEISNFTNHYRSGHFYFTLKDDSSALKAVMFSRYAQNIRFEPYDGLKVLVRGS